MRILPGLVAFLMTAYAVPAAATEHLALTGYFEPSGIVQLADGRIVVVEDEKVAPFGLLTATDGQRLASAPLRLASVWDALLSRPAAGPFNDLEAVTLGPDGYVYAITSHARTRSGNREAGREKLVRFRVKNARAIDLEVVTSLRDQITAMSTEFARAGYKKAAGEGLNIEGLAYDSKASQLLIGLRQPVIDGQAIILALPDLEAAFSLGQVPRLAPQPAFLDLDGGGIRALEFDPVLGGFLIISRKEKNGAAFKLWFWDAGSGQPPRRIRPGKDVDLSKAEGVAFLRHNGVAQIMVVFDNGQKSRGHDASYILLSHDDLSIDAAPP